MSELEPSERWTMMQAIPYITLFMDSNHEIGDEAKRLGLTHENLREMDRYLEAMDAA